LGDTTSTYPNPLTDPRSKGYEYILKYVKAAWNDGKSYIPSTMFYYGRSRMAEIREYGIGKQSVNKYKKILLGDNVTDKSSFNVDWNPISFLTKFREIAISKIIQRDFDVEAFCVDPLAKSEEDEYFNKMKVKIMMRQAAEQAGSELSQSPLLQPQAEEPQDMEQLQMQMKFGYKHQKAMESELGISLIQQQNNISEIRKRVCENLFDYGVGGYKEWIDEKGMVKFREIVPENLIVSYCTKNDFSDLIHWGEVVYMSVTDLVPYFKEEQIDYICKNVAGKYGNPASYPVTNVPGRTWDKFKVAVFDMEFIDFDSTVYKKEIDGRGNLRTMPTDYGNMGRPDTIEFFKGATEPKYIDTTRKVVRRAKWLVGTDMMFDWGLATNMKRKQSSWWDTSLSCHLYSWNFYNMMYSGITERLIPLEDNLCLTWYKLQNLKNKLIPYLIKLDINALEGVNFGKGGKKMTPADLIDFMLQEFVVLYRSSDLLSKNPNYDPARIEATGQLAAFQMLYEELQQGLQMMRDITGLNEITDGSTPNSKNLNSTNAAAIESTNNALHLVMNADKQLMNRLSDAIVQRIQIAVQLGKVEGYAKALGTDTVKFYQISPDISNYELGIFIKDAPTYAERQAFIQDLNLKDSQGLIDPADKIIVMSCTNLKQAAEVLAYKIEQRKQQEHARQMELLQEQSQGNIQAAEAAASMEMQKAELDCELEIEKIGVEKQWDFIIEQMKKSSDFDEGKAQSMAKIISSQVQANAKVISSRIAADAAKDKAKKQAAKKKTA
jgi:hypothetical protein